MNACLSIPAALTVLLALGLTGAVAAVQPTGDAALDAIKAHVKPWHELKEEWIARSTVVVVAEYHRQPGPCIDLGDGRLARPVLSAFVVKKWLKGAGAAEEFVAEVYGGEPGPFPHCLVTGRMYMVIMKPGPESLARLKDPQLDFRPVRNIELVAIVDLSQSKEEAEAEKVTATKSGTYEGYEFTPAKWEKLRQAKKVDFAEQGRILKFIEKVVLAGNPAVARVRSYLGTPDRWYWNEDGLWYEYRLNLEAYNNPRVDAVFSELKLQFGFGLVLKGYSVRHCKYTEVKPNSQIIRDLTVDERKQLGIQ
jgi:hypothetical protein